MSAWDDATREDVDKAEVVAAVSPFPHVPVPSSGGKPEPIETDQLMYLHKWMAEHHARLQQMTGEKAHEYGSLDLSIMGASMSKLWPGIGESAPPAAQLQAAIAFYLMGKVARVLSALAEGKPPPTDSWLDAEVYAMMGGYVQEHGQWP